MIAKLAWRQEIFLREGSLTTERQPKYQTQVERRASPLGHENPSKTETLAS